MRISKRAIWMWAAGSLFRPAGVAILITWFIIGDLWLYFGPQKNLGQIVERAITADKWVFFGLSAIVLYFVFSSVSNALYKYWSINYELEDAALKIVRGFYQKKESFIPYKNIQNIEIKMTAGERFWGLATILIYTSAAGDSSNPDLAEGYIDGLRYNGAVALKDELLRRMK